ncbi:PDDEXK-like family protein [Crenobacter luteus]|uniref:hypothetical protein n=1 Tax=Crenobacter luteus TaxID=1452487 RepID=UPI0012E71072|nr:hypothetical protein [Crenobacter luteus]
MSNSNLNTKQIGDAGEYFALALFGFHGLPAIKAPDNWPDYDLLVRLPDGSLMKVSVKTSRESGTQPELVWGDTDEADFLVYVVIPAQQGDQPEAWVFPVPVISALASRSDKTGQRWISLKKIRRLPELAGWRNHWRAPLTHGAANQAPDA